MDANLTPGNSPQLDTGSSFLFALAEWEDATYPATLAKAAAQVLNGSKIFSLGMRLWRFVVLLFVWGK